VFFGGGLDVAHKGFDPRTAAATDPDGAGPRPSTFDIQGNWIYMVDVETGAVLYKRQLCSPYRSNAVGNPANPCVPAGSVPSAMAVVDTDLNGYVDRLYVGSTGGYMFRVDLQVFTDDGTPSAKKEIVVPALEDLTTNALDGNGNPTAVTVKRIPETDSAGNPLWVPKVIFDANHDLATDSTVPRPMYFAPAVLIYQDAGGYALAFGTGDREDLWNRTAQPGVSTSSSTTPTRPACRRRRWSARRSTPGPSARARRTTSRRSPSPMVRCATTSCSHGRRAAAAGTWCSTPTSG